MHLCLNMEQKYSDLENIFHELLEYTLGALENDSGLKRNIPTSDREWKGYWQRSFIGALFPGSFDV